MGFGSVRDDLINLIAIGTGGDKQKAAAKVAELEAMIRNEAKVGAEQSIPTIKKAVQMPLIAAFVLGGIALFFSVGTYIYVRRHS